MGDPSRRRNALREYLLACVADNVFSWADLANPTLPSRLLHVLSSDCKEVLKDLGRQGGANAMRVVGNLLMSFADGLKR